MTARMRALLRYLVARLGESSTWQGLGFLIALCGGKWAVGLDWGAAAALGGVVSGAIKTAFPDTFTKD